jgi:hypothetical protein
MRLPHFDPQRTLHTPDSSHWIGTSLTKDNAHGLKFSGSAMRFETAERTMWELVQTYTGRVGYQRGTKSDGLSAAPPVIDCSGWTKLLLTNSMQAENEAMERTVFGSGDVEALQVCSDRIIQEIEIRTGFVLERREITIHSLPRCATIGLKVGEPSCANNHPRHRGITHIVQVVRRPEDGAPFVSESFGGAVSPGVSLTPLEKWLVQSRPYLRAGEMWAVDLFRLASKMLNALSWPSKDGRVIPSNRMTTFG